jgi:hypothetical protein
VRVNDAHSGSKANTEVSQGGLGPEKSGAVKRRQWIIKQKLDTKEK